MRISMDLIRQCKIKAAAACRMDPIPPPILTPHIRNDQKHQASPPPIATPLIRNDQLHPAFPHLTTNWIRQPFCNHAHQHYDTCLKLYQRTNTFMNRNNTTITTTAGTFNSEFEREAEVLMSILGFAILCLLLHLSHV